MLNGTTLSLFVYEFDLKENEIGVRYMVLENRLAPRELSEAFMNALEVGMTCPVFFRGMIGSVRGQGNELAFMIATMKPILGFDYDEYRKIRSNLTQIYARGILEQFPHLKRVVGISCEPIGQNQNCSEEMLYMEQCEWTEEEKK